ncbi:hypothetical protein [uncultured Desulfosarcina sp.]|uniref:hypothetical protein n=1 Tax=uncultured Desulfosarcina sp. TaxID=218289 RepID=UPI0029C8EBF5|nr:hypothetical protein [uncultured Desulfosarcina sp.]
MKLSVHGSRTLNDERVKILLMEEIEAHGITEIVTHAEPEGVCKVARDLCKEKAIPLKLHFLNFKYLRGAFEHRSVDVLNDGDRAIFIHDGRSKGTANELILAKKMNVPHTFHELEKTEYKSSVGFEITQDWGAELEPLELPEIPKLV